MANIASWSRSFLTSTHIWCFHGVTGQEPSWVEVFTLPKTESPTCPAFITPGSRSSRMTFSYVSEPVHMPFHNISVLSATGPPSTPSYSLRLLNSTPVHGPQVVSSEPIAEILELTLNEPISRDGPGATAVHRLWTRSHPLAIADSDELSVQSARGTSLIICCKRPATNNGDVALWRLRSDDSDGVLALDRVDITFPENTTWHVMGPVVFDVAAGRLCATALAERGPLVTYVYDLVSSPERTQPIAF
ncbi:hypothetical protein NEOLEDRAFT_1139552 [Neolentinus lepideus HHB14362 ss-1]|uniref:Uncharacterized protein n=1 Tax=Neolentinus lepideus HHB14362 ss-1 TaxID=1314782 RepID=A0A165PSL9_9AGAM|nr:hypothetical protein NEOLEDRAFT_1139552 [Neolentinus lepideus HHB14362 ss-1]